MTIEDLKAYQDMKRTVRELEERLQMVYEASPKPNENPGGRSSVRTSSDPTAAKANNAIEIQAELEAVLAKLRKKTNEVIQFSLCIEDPEVGAIIRLHYIDGLSWKQAGLRLYGDTDAGDLCRMRIKRFFRNS